MRITFLFALLAAPALAAPPDVAVIKPVERELFDHEDVTGRTEAGTAVEIRSRLTGYVDKVAFKEGSAVKRGELLIQLDVRLQRAELEKAEAERKRAEAGLKRAEADLARIAKAVENKAAAREELEKAAAVGEEAKATMLAARAVLDVAKLNLEFTRIGSPIDGKVGRANATAGNLVREADLLTTVYALDPLHVVFDLDERTALRLMQYARGRKDARATVGLALTGDTGFPRTADVDFVDPTFDSKTGALRVRAVLPNAKEEIRPGQFVRVRVPLGDPHKALVIPESALFQTKGEYAVLVVNGKNVLEERSVKVTQADEGLVEVQAGLKADDRVVRDLARHRAGEEVRPQPVKDPPAKSPGLGLRTPAASPPGPFPGSGPALVVTTTYAGATAQAVEEAVAGPIEAQLFGMEKLTRQIAACADDGTMRLTLLFEKGTDLNAAQREAQNRIEVALPKLPRAVIELGIRVEKRGVYLGAVALVSPANRHDHVFLANLAKVNLKDDLARIGGVAEVAFYGDTEPGKQIHLAIDREKAAALGMTTSEILDTLSRQGLSVEAAPGGRVLRLTVTGRLVDPDQLKNVILKAGKEGQMVRLGTVAQIEMAEGLGNTTRVDGRPAAILVVSRLPDADPKDTAKALRDFVADLAKRLPEGVEVKVLDGER